MLKTLVLATPVRCPSADKNGTWYATGQANWLSL